MIHRIKDRLTRLTILRSLRVRIFLILTLMGMLPGIMVQTVLLGQYEERAVDVKISEVANQFKIVVNHLIHYNYLQDSASEMLNAELNQMSSLYEGRIMVVNRNFRVVKDTYGINEGKTIISEEVIRCFKGEEITDYDEEDGFIEMAIPIRETLPEEQESRNSRVPVIGVLLCSISTDTIALTMSLLGQKALVFGGVIVILVIVTAAAVSYLLVQPFHKVTNAISEVKEGYTDEALSVPDYEETEHIVEAFNQVLGRIRLLDQSRQDFVSNVSHELKTPLASMKVLADSLLMQEDVPKELYQEFMTDIAEEIERENKIINDLLSLVKLDKTNGQLNISTVDINQLLELVMKRLRTIARKDNIELVLESNRPVTAEVDEVKLSLALTNLVENAIKYNKENGWVKVVLDADYQFFTVNIEDSGIGIPEEEYEHIYERFYRVDKSRSRQIGGTGLGLAITRNVVLMHRGAVQVSSVEQEGSVFTVKIPLTYSK